MLKLYNRCRVEAGIKQPPSGGCVLKHKYLFLKDFFGLQPPSGGCVLKQNLCTFSKSVHLQPPSGGCVLKL